ncbi:MULTISPECIES: hypothetical protein [unclassified Leifsonia]|uniref:hypothetical protein n=1 Tax=unclassified Leifsonia TaxID=2663824 RepID=UPI0006FA273C|nr:MULTISPECIES: hypothetical protein [unclassified Leifsonia]KQX05528.1 hypothetical protein ASC59_15585 [Leifsonia sp. Root1293]KRA09162.1 hypothetical protein ASD61_15580 [Leifsonia sp. Root60]
MTETTPEEAEHTGTDRIDGAARTYSFVVRPETARRLATDHLVYTTTRKLSIFIGVAMVAGVLLSLVGVAMINSSAGPSIIGGILFVIIFGAVIVLNWRSVARQWDALNPVGTELQTEFSDTELRSRTALGSGEVLYSALDQVVVFRGTVLLRLRGTTAYSLYPIELFPEDERRRLAASVTP